MHAELLLPSNTLMLFSILLFSAALELSFWVSASCMMGSMNFSLNSLDAGDSYAGGYPGWGAGIELLCSGNGVGWYSSSGIWMGVLVDLLQAAIAWVSLWQLVQYISCCLHAPLLWPFLPHLWQVGFVLVLDSVWDEVSVDDVSQLPI